MAKCKICKKNIPDGTEYCKECLEKEKAKTNESYLDSLLNSVKNPAPTAESVYKKKSNSNADGPDQNLNKASDSKLSDNDIFKFDIGDIEDFDQFNLSEDLDDNELISDEALFGEDLDKFFSDDSQKNKLDDNTKSMPLPDNIEKTTATAKTQNPVMDETEKDREAIDTDSMVNVALNINENNSKDEDIADNTKADSDINQNENTVDSADVLNSFLKTEKVNNVDNSGEIKEKAELPEDNAQKNDINDNSSDTDLNDLINQIDGINSSQEKVNDTSEPDDTKENNAELETKNMEKAPDTIPDNKPEEEDDFISLLNQISEDDPVADDVKAINDLMNGTKPETSNDSEMPSDVGEVFSDALKAVSNLNDPNLNEAEVQDQVSDKKSKKAKKKKDKKKKKKNSETDSEGNNVEDKPKVGLLKRLFGNVEEKNASKKKKQASASLESAAPEVIEAAKSSKTKKSKKGKKGKPAEEKDAEGKDKGTSDNKKVKKKKEKKPKKQKSTDVVQVIDELEEDEGRINRVGATIVFVFFALLAIVIYVGSNAVSYTLGIQQATNYFKHKEYTQAYDEVEGIDIKDEDVEIYNKILTVMLVNKQLNSYNNYCTIGEYPQALDSLLKGLKRYDTYKKLATIYGVRTDMDYVREQILAELKHQYHLSEEDAFHINSLDNRKEYSMKVYDVSSNSK